MSVLLWRVALAVTLSRPVHIAVHGTGSFLVEQDSILRLSSSVSRPFRCFHALVVINGAALNVGMLYVF